MSRDEIAVKLRDAVVGMTKYVFDALTPAEVIDMTFGADEKVSAEDMRLTADLFRDATIEIEVVLNVKE